MASDRSPLSKRLKALAQRAGVPVDDARPTERDAASATPPASPAQPPAPATPADEQPTGEVPVVPEPAAGDHGVLRVADDQPTVASEPLRPTGGAPSPDPFAHEDGPTMTPPVVPARPVDEPPADVAASQPAAEPGGTPSTPEDDDEPFSPRSTIWPQTAPTPRFERRNERPAAHSTADPTFPAPSPAPADEDPSAVEPGVTDRPPSAATSIDAAASPEPAPAEPTTVAATAPATPQAGRAVEVAPSNDVTSEQPALESDQPAGKTGRLGALRRLRGGRRADATAVASPVTSPAPSADEAPAAEPQPLPATEPAPAAPVTPAAPAYEPPAKPSFSERAALRRRAKTLRARRDAGLLELGAIVLDQRRFGDPTGGSLTRRRTDELADIDGELAAIEQVLDDDGPAETVAQLGVVRCLSCTALVGPHDRFCVQCGAPRPESDGRPSHAA